MPRIDPRLRDTPIPSVSVEAMERDHAARFARVGGSAMAFVDQRIPGHRREIINIIGMSVTENVKDPALAPHVRAPAHGFAITCIRNAPKGEGAALHRHATEEVSLPLKGTWSVFGRRRRGTTGTLKP